MVKMIFLVKRLPHLSREEFQRYWREHHAAMVRERAEVIGIRRYVQRHVVSEPMFERAADIRGGLAAYDGIAELWWERESDRTPAQQAAARQANQDLYDDGRTFIDMSASPVMFVEDVEVVGRNAYGVVDDVDAADEAE